RQFVEVLLERGDKETVTKILNNYAGYLAAKDSEPRRKAAIGLSQLADLFAAPGVDLVGAVVLKLAKALGRETDPETQNLLGAAFVRLSSEATQHKQYGPLKRVCAAMVHVAKTRPVLSAELRTRVGVENRLPEFIEDAVATSEFPPELVSVLRRTCPATIEHLAERFCRCVRR